MKKLITILLAILILMPIASAGFQTIYNPFTSKLDYVRNSNWSNSNLTTGDIIPATDRTFDLGTTSLRWDNVYGYDTHAIHALYVGNGFGTSNYIQYGLPDIQTHGYGQVMTIDVNDIGAGELTLGEAGDGDSVKIEGATQISNDDWLSYTNNASDSNINVLKVNEDDELVFGTNPTLGGIDFAEDSGAAVLIDMPVSSSATAGDEMSYAFRIDGNVVAKIYAQADGTGGVTNISFMLPNGSTLTDNATCATLASPDGTGTLNACNT